MEIIWKDIVGYEGLYQVSNMGGIRSIHFSQKDIIKERKPVKSRGYYRIGLSKNNILRYYHVHRIVWEAFNGPIPEGMQVNHINEDKTDNRLVNLNLMTRKENVNWGTGIKRRVQNNPLLRPVKQLNDDKILAIFESSCQAERTTGIRANNITACCKGKRKTAGGFKWEYEKRED